MRNILVVNVNWIGDVVFSSPVFKALKDAYPQAKISCLAPSRVRAIVECIPEVAEFIEYDEKGKHWAPWAKLGLIFELRRRKLDAAFLLHGSTTRALLVYLAGIPVRVGYDTKDRKKFLTHVTPSNGTLHRADHYLKVIESFGIKIQDRKSYLAATKEITGEAQELLKKYNLKEGEFVIIHPGANWELKRWPTENFTLLIDKLMRERKEKVILTGSEEEKPLAEVIVNPLADKPQMLTGKLNLKQLIGLMSRAKLVISADSGPLHIANSLGTPVVGLFGPTRPEITGPRGSGQATVIQHDVGCNRQACYYLECPDNICMQSISVEDVLNATHK